MSSIKTGARAKPLGFGFPTAYTIVFGLIVLAAVLTWIIPAGQYARVNDKGLGHEVAVPGSYQTTPSNPQTAIDVIRAPVGGFYDAETEKTRAIDVALFVLFVGGFMGVVNKTRAIDIAMFGAMRGLAGREHWLIPILMALFALGGTTYGMEEEAMPLLVLLVPVMLRAGYDSLVAVAIVLIGTTVGRFGSTINPFLTGIASNAAGIKFIDGVGLRLAMLVIAWTISTVWVMRYAARVQRNPARSLLADRREEIAAHFHTDEVPTSRLSTRHGIVLGLFALTFAVLIWGVSSRSWWMADMSALFLGAAILIAVAGGIGERGFIDGFLGGSRDLLGVALIIGLARGVLIIMNDGQITDTILHAGETMLNGLSRIAFINSVLSIEFLMAFAVPSQSGLSVLTTPVMAPLADFSGVPRALIVTAVQSGASVSNLLSPTVGATMGMLAIGRVPYQRWLRFALPLAFALFLIAAVSLSISAAFSTVMPSVVP